MLAKNRRSEQIPGPDWPVREGDFCGLKSLADVILKSFMILIGARHYRDKLRIHVLNCNWLFTKTNSKGARCTDLLMVHHYKYVGR